MGWASFYSLPYDMLLLLFYLSITRIIINYFFSKTRLTHTHLHKYRNAHAESLPHLQMCTRAHIHTLTLTNTVTTSSTFIESFSCYQFKRPFATRSATEDSKPQKWFRVSILLSCWTIYTPKHIIHVYDSSILAVSFVTLFISSHRSESLLLSFIALFM